MTSAGRISIASDGDSENTKQRFSVTDNFIEETHNEVGKLIAEADETLAQADETVFEADTILACIDINPLEENSTYPTNGNALSSINGDFSCMDVFVKEDLKETRVEIVDNQLSVENEPETVSKEPENISVETESQTQEPVGTSEELVNKTQEPVSKSEEPVNNNQELVSEWKEPVSKLEEPENKTQEPVSKLEEPENKTQEPVSKLEEPENKTKEPVSKLEEPENKTQEPVSKVEEPSVKQQEKTDDGTEKPKVVKPVKKGMDMTEEWHEDPIPGMGVAADNDSDSSDSRSRHSSGDSDSSDSTRPGGLCFPDDIDTTENPGDLEWENDTPVSIPKEPIAEYSAEDEYQDAKHWRGVEINGKQQKIDLKVIDPYKKVLTHGGYYGDGLNAIIVFSGCYLPDRSRKDYNYVMDNLFLYVISTLELLVAEDYMIVYFHGATPRRQMPSFGWLKKCYQMIDRRLKKNLKGLLLIHPTLWLRTIVLMTKPFISSKFSSKLKFVRTLQDLSNIVPVDYIYIPEEVKKYDSLLQHRSPAHSSSSSTPHTPS
ncbi:BMCC1 [Mytilus edulis]|uniref:PRUNE2 n=1 Tax=Mytilus edulis TaxID=6550 RepID=A0A8S3TAT7_MYTED|nr:BMCC1 [Mytilus edulis]